MATTNDRDNLNRDSNPDPITGSPGAHPVGTGVGAAGGGAAGAAIGAAVSGPAAPAGAVIGAVVGAVAGGLAGKGAAEAVNPTAEDQYWRSNYANRPYYEKDYTYEQDYRPAYEYGWTSASQHQGKSFNEAEGDLASGWEKTKAKSRLGWDKAKFATRDAFDRLNPSDRSASTGSSMSNAAYPGVTAGTTMDESDDFVRTSRTRYQGRSFDDAESDLRRDWSSRGSRDTWDNVRDKVRSAWHKVERAMPGDADRDGR